MNTLRVEGLTKDYGESKGVFGFHLNLKEEDIVLLLGPNGAGKTTAIRGILGLISTDSGDIKYNEDIVGEHPTDFMKSVGAMVSSPAYYEYMTGYENLKLYASFYPSVDDAAISRVLDLVELREAAPKKVAQYSTGMKQRLDFARAVLHNPDLLILDEPFNGMDIEKKAGLKDFLRDRSLNQGAMTLISSHMVGDLENLANRVVILYEGQVLYDGRVSDIKEEGLSLEDYYLQVIKEYKDNKKARAFETTNQNQIGA